MLFYHTFLTTTVERLRRADYKRAARLVYLHVVDIFQHVTRALCPLFSFPSRSQLCLSCASLLPQQTPVHDERGIAHILTHSLLCIYNTSWQYVITNCQYWKQVSITSECSNQNNTNGKLKNRSIKEKVSIFCRHFLLNTSYWTRLHIYVMRVHPTRVVEWNIKIS